LNNNLKIITSAKDIDIKNWDEFVLNHPNGNIFQLPDFYQVYEKSNLCEPVLVAALQESEIIGLVLGNIKKEFKNKIGNMTSRAIILGGPLVQNNDAEIMCNLLNTFDLMVKDKVIYTQYRNLFCCYNQKELFEKNGYSYKDHLDIHVDLTKSENELWNEINPKAKNRIRGARKRGTEFVVEDSVKALLSCYNILIEVYTRIKLPLPDLDYFLNLFNVVNSEKIKFRIFTTQSEGKIIGCLLAVGFKETLFGLYNGAYSEYYDKLPNDLIPWEMFKWAKNNGYNRYDWLGAGEPEVPYGVRDYKLKFGGEIQNYGRFEKINKPFLYNIGKLGLKLYPVNQYQ
jgi:serine/alanine adding enzyme